MLWGLGSPGSGQAGLNCSPTSNQDPPPGVLTLAGNAAGAGFERVSLKSDGTEIVQCPGDNGNRHPSIADDGAIVAWVCDAASVVIGEPNVTGTKQIYARELPGGPTFLVTGTAPAATPPGMSGVGDAPSDFPWVVGERREILFQGSAALTQPPRAQQQIWLHSIDLASNTVLSANVVTGAAANGPCEGVHASADGRFVVFSSFANNLVGSLQTPAPFTDCPGQNPSSTLTRNVFLLDRGDSGIDPTLPIPSWSVNPSITWISVGRDGAGDCTDPDGQNNWPSISANGCRIAFESKAHNLVPAIPGSSYNPGDSNVFLWERSTQEIRLVSHAEGFPATPGNDTSYQPRISADGRFVVFRGFARDLESGVEPPLQNPDEDVFVYDIANQQATYVSLNADGAMVNSSGFKGSGISPNGRWITISSVNPEFNKLNGVSSPNMGESYLRDRDGNADGTFDDPVTRFMALANATPAAFADGRTVPPTRWTSDSSRIVLMTEASDLTPPPVPADDNASGSGCVPPPQTCRQCGFDIYVREVY